MILDEVLGLVDNGIITTRDLSSLLANRAEDVSVIMTGIKLEHELCQLADDISQIDDVNYKIFN